VIALETQQTLRIKPWRTTRIECMSGVLWVTLEGELRDFIVAPGESIDVRRGLTIALALEPSCVRLVHKSVRAWLQGLLEPARVKLRWWRGATLGGSSSLSAGTTDTA
jgi:hypothetical protein